MTMQLHQIAEKVINRPLLIHPDKASVILSALRDRMPDMAGVQIPAPVGPDASRFFGSNGRNGGYAMNRAANGVAAIPIVGSLVNRGAWIGASSGLVSYEGIAAQLDEALVDPEVHAIALDIESPGGEAAGMAALAAKVRAINAEKPIVAVVNDMAASAAYGIASGASRIIVSDTSLTGSIGVVLVHQDHSQRLADEGIAVTIIHAGAHKVDGHPFGPLPDTVKADLQAEVAKHYGIFLDLVAAGRGERLSADAARATEARVFLGRDAIDAGLADEVGTFGEVVDDLAAMASAGGVQKRGRGFMSASTNTPAEAPETITPEGHAAAVNAARAEGAAGATERIKAILTCDEAKGREEQAKAIAFETDMAPEAAAAVLKAAPAGASVPSLADRAAEGQEAGGKPKATHKPAPAINAADIYAARRDH